KFSIENIKIEKGNKATDWTPAPEDVNSQIDNIRIGGRNLVLDSKNDKYTNHTLYGKPYNLSLDWIIGETYTVTVKGNPDNEDHYFSAYSDDGYTNLCNLTYDSKKDLWIGTGVAKESSRNLDKLLTIYDMPKDGNYLSSIEWIKLEKGNKSTDWSPAPEDIETSISTVSSKIDQKADSIELSVNKINNYLNVDNSLINSDLRNGWEGWTTNDDDKTDSLNFADKIDSPYWAYTFSGSTEKNPTDTTTNYRDYL